jgi:glutathione S-transferase
MKLYYAAASPFVRKVLIAAHELGLAQRIELVTTKVSPVDPNQALGRDNPLMKVPTLLTDDGTALYDSQVICDYLDSLGAQPKLLPAKGAARWRTLTLHSLADGVLEAAILCRYEDTARPEAKRDPVWRAGQEMKIKQALDQLEQAPELASQTVDLGTITLACAFAYLEFRNIIGDIRSGRPRLSGWYKTFAERPSMKATVPQG